MNLPLLSAFTQLICTFGWRSRTSEVRKPACRVVAALLFFFSFSAFAIDFSGPLQDVSVSVNDHTITYQVFDPQRGTFVQQSTNMPPGYFSPPSTSGGVIAWYAGNTVYYRIYDPGRGSWMGSSLTAGSP